MMGNRIRWGWLLVSIASAVALLVVSVVLRGWSGETVSDVLLAVSSSALVLVVGVILEPRLTRRIGETTREVLRDETEPLAQRILSLEELAEEQIRQRQNIREEITEITEALRTAPNRQSVLNVMLRADELNLFDPHCFRVRTTTDIEGPELFIFAYDAVQSELWLNFSPVLYGSTDPTLWDPWHGPPDENPVGILWSKEQSTVDILRSLEENLLASDAEYGSDFDFSHGLGMLAKSLEATFAVTTPGLNSSGRLLGELICLINDEWVLTTHGLESLRADLHYSLADDVLESSSCPAQHSKNWWDEALAYFQARREEVQMLIQARHAYEIANS